MNMIKLFFSACLGIVYVYTIHSFFVAYFAKPKPSWRYFYKAILIIYFCTTNFSNNHYNLIVNLVLITAMSLCYEANKLNRLIPIGLIYLLIMASEVITMLAAKAILNLDIETVTQQDHYVLTLTAISKLVLLLIVRVIAPIFEQTRKRRNIRLPQFYVAMIFVIPFFSIVIIYTIYKFTQNNNYDAFSVLAVSLLLMINFLVFYLYDKLLKNSEAEFEVALLRQQMEMYNKSYIDMGTSQERIRTLTHNYKNKLLWLYSEVQKEEGANRLKKDIESMMGEINQLTNYCYSGIPLIDTIINHKASYAEQFGIKIIPQIDISGILSVHERDFSVLLGNALDNAIEACRDAAMQQRTIRIFMAEDRANLIIEISNPCEKPLKLDAENNPITTKENPETHGFGLKSMRHIVDEMDGYLSISVEHSEFMLNVILFNAFQVGVQKDGSLKGKERIM